MALICRWQKGNARCDVHRIDEAQTLLHTAPADKGFDGVGDVDVIAPVRRFKPEMFGESFHGSAMVAEFKGLARFNQPHGGDSPAMGGRMEFDAETRRGKAATAAGLMKMSEHASCFW